MCLFACMLGVIRGMNSFSNRYLYYNSLNKTFLCSNMSSFCTHMCARAHTHTHTVIHTCCETHRFTHLLSHTHIHTVSHTCCQYTLACTHMRTSFTSKPLFWNQLKLTLCVCVHRIGTKKKYKEQRKQQTMCLYDKAGRGGGVKGNKCKVVNDIKCERAAKDYSITPTSLCSLSPSCTEKKKKKIWQSLTSRFPCRHFQKMYCRTNCQLSQFCVCV